MGRQKKWKGEKKVVRKDSSKGKEVIKKRKEVESEIKLVRK